MRADFEFAAFRVRCVDGRMRILPRRRAQFRGQFKARWTWTSGLLSVELKLSFGCGQGLFALEQEGNGLISFRAQYWWNHLIKHLIFKQIMNPQNQNWSTSKAPTQSRNVIYNFTKPFITCIRNRFFRGKNSLSGQILLQIWNKWIFLHILPWSLSCYILSAWLSHRTNYDSLASV